MAATVTGALCEPSTRTIYVDGLSTNADAAEALLDAVLCIDRTSQEPSLRTHQNVRTGGQDRIRLCEKAATPIHNRAILADLQPKQCPNPACHIGTLDVPHGLGGVTTDHAQGTAYGVRPQRPEFPSQETGTPGR